MIRSLGHKRVGEETGVNGEILNVARLEEGCSASWNLRGEDHIAEGFYHVYVIYSR